MKNRNFDYEEEVSVILDKKENNTAYIRPIGLTIAGDVIEYVIMTDFGLILETQFGEIYNWESLNNVQQRGIYTFLQWES